MNTEEALTVTRIARAAWPAQRWDEYTIDIWVESLLDYDRGEAQLAIKRLVKLKTFVSIAELIAEINRHHNDANRKVRDRNTFRAIETARSNHDPETSHASAEHTRQAFAKAIATARAKRGHTEPADTTQEPAR